MAEKENILIIGYCGSNENLGEIVYYESYDDFCSIYSDKSKVKDALEIVNKIQFDGIHVMNLNDSYINTYIDATEIIKQHNFYYVVPVDIHVSDSYYNATRCNHIHLLDYMAKVMYDTNDSVMVCTDKHASLYEDIDNFLSDMVQIESDMKACIGIENYGENFIFVANNLKDISLSNVALAVLLTTTDINVYPSNDKIGDAIFDIDSNDIGMHSIVYFRSHDNRETTVENLINMDRKVEPEKIVTINRIIKYMYKDMDFSEFEGKMYVKNKKNQVKKKLIKYMDYYTGWILREYEIISVEFYKTDPGAGIIIAQIEIVPIGCFEKSRLTIEVNE